jgi:hypothetical protein
MTAGDAACLQAIPNPYDGFVAIRVFQNSRHDDINDLMIVLGM